MNIAMILAGGVDPNFKMDIPKQFVNVNNIPLIVYTLKKFQQHPMIDQIIVVCLEGWQEMVKSYAKQFHIDKLTDVVIGGSYAQDSSYNGTERLKKICNSNDIVVIHDAIRPLVSEEIITDSIKVCKKHKMGVAAINSMDTIMKLDGNNTGKESISRYEVMRIQTPQAYEFGYLEKCHQRAVEENISRQFDINSMMSKLGETIYFSKGSDTNLKVNTVEDVTMFKALYGINCQEG